MIRAIVFDCFGVLTSDNLVPFLDEQFGHDARLRTEVKHMGRAVDAGERDYDAFIRHIADRASLPEHDVRTRMESNIPNEELFVYIAEVLRPRYKIGMLSNAGKNWLTTLFSPEQLGLFDAIVLSHEIGVAKPDPRAYAAIADKLGVAMQECVLIDDLPRHISGAERAGMAALHYTHTQDMIYALATLLERN